MGAVLPHSISVEGHLMEEIWQAVWEGVKADFSDLPGVAAVTQFVLRMLLATILGGLLGY
jgi:hypothetical protein